MGEDRKWSVDRENGAFDPTRTSGLNLNLPDPETVYVPDLSESALACLRPQWPVLISGHYRNSLVENKFHVL